MSTVWQPWWTAFRDPAKARPSRPRPHLSERLHSLIIRGVGAPMRDFSQERVERCMAALNAARDPPGTFVGEVVWLASPTAFTLPGPYLYVSRRFIERSGRDAPTAFVLAHEMGHHDLGHLSVAKEWMDKLGSRSYLESAALTLEAFTVPFYSREQELAADAFAIGLCRKAGFDGKECLEAFDIFINWTLDHRDLEAVYGPDDETVLRPDLASNPIERKYLEFMLWRSRHRRSHPALMERVEILKNLVA